MVGRTRGGWRFQSPLGCKTSEVTYTDGSMDLLRLMGLQVIHGSKGLVRSNTRIPLVIKKKKEEEDQWVSHHPLIFFYLYIISTLICRFDYFIFIFL